MASLRQTQADINSNRAAIRRTIDEIFVESTENDRITQYPLVVRNILIVGLSKSGKTTFQNVIQDPRWMPENDSLFGKLKMEPTLKRDIHVDDFNVTLNMIEIPEAMIDEECDLSAIDQACSKMEIQEFHLILWCTSFTAGIDGRALKLFLRLIQHLDGNKAKRNLCLMITRCESKDDRQRNNMKAEVNRDQFFQKLVPYTANEILFSGAFNIDKWNAGDYALVGEFETISHYRKNFLQSIRMNDVPFSLSKFQMVSTANPSQCSDRHRSRHPISGKSNNQPSANHVYSLGDKSENKYVAFDLCVSL